MHNSLFGNKRLLVSVSMILGISMLLISPGIFSAHGQFTGLICITSSTTATSCSSGPPSLGPFGVGSNFTVGVFVQNSDPIGGWDMYVAANPTVLRPTSAALGNLVPSPSITSICINGVAQTGSCTVGTANGPGVVEATTVESTGGTVCNNPPPGPCSGMAFTITYKVVGAANNTSLFYPASSGCTPSSVSSPPGVCVLITNNLGTPLPETIQGATVTTRGTGSPDFTLSAASTSLSVRQGGSSTDVLTATSFNSFNGTVTLSNNVLPSGISVVYKPNPLVVASNRSTRSNMTVTASPGVGNIAFTVTVTGMSGSLSHAVNIVVQVTTPPKTGLVCIISPSTVTSCPVSPPMFGPVPVGSNFTVGVFIQNSEPMAGFDIYVKINYSIFHPVSASMGSLIASPSLTSICFNGVATTGSCTVSTANGPGVVEVTTIDARGVNECGNVAPCSGLAFTITYKAIAASSGTGIFYPTSSGCTPSSVNGTNTCVLVTNSVGGDLFENIQGASVSSSGSLPPDFTIAASSTMLSVRSGGSASDILKVTSVSNFNGTVTLSNNMLPSTITVVYVPNPLVVASGKSASSTMTITVTSSISSGTSFTLTVTGKSGSLSHSVMITVSVTPSPVAGLVCIISPITSAPSCPSSPLSLGPLTVGSTFTVGVFVQNSQPLGGWDMYVAANPKILSPTSAALGTLVPNPSITSICINGVAQTGSCTVGTANGPGVVEATTVESTGGTVCNNPPPGPCSGLAFTITYKVVGATNGTSLFYPTSSGCALSSVSSPPDVCVLIEDNVGNILPEKIQGATVFTVSDFSITAAASSLSIPAGSSTSGTLTITGIGGFTGNVALTNSSVPSGVAVLFVPDPVTITSLGGMVKSSMNIFVGSIAGTSFTLTVIATTGSITHTIAIAVTVTAAPSFTSGQLHWIHHVSLSKTNGTQTWTAIIANPLSTNVDVVVRVVGSSATNPSLTFDVTCGVTCVNTVGGVNTTPGLTPLLVAGGAKSFSFSFSQLVSPSFVNTKITFTATLYWTSGTVYNPGSSKSGSFAVVP